tara:strand:- start:414 stop:734 length:321 start_codon:yes stop_codon:yes gene_type:complete
MRIDKKDINIFLALWIKTDPELWGELRDIQIKLLIQRIVKEKTFAELSKLHKVPEVTLRKIFEAILKRIEFGLSKEISDHLRTINQLIEGKKSLRIESDFDKVNLN